MENPYIQLIKLRYLTKVDSIKLHTNYQRIEFVKINPVTNEAYISLLTLREVTKDYIKVVQVVDEVPNTFKINMEFLSISQTKKVYEYLESSQEFRNLA